MARLSSRLYAAVCVVALLVYMTLPAGSATVFYDAFGLSCFAIIVWFLARPGVVTRGRGVWVAFAVVNLLAVAGDIASSVLASHTPGGETPFPSVADGIYLLGYPVLAGTILWAARLRGSGRDALATLDGVMVAAAAAIPVWVLWVGPSLDGSGLSNFEAAVSIAYPVMDLILLGCIVRFVLATGRWTTTGGLLVAGLLLNIVADVAYNVTLLAGAYSTPSPIDLGWLITSVLWGLAVLHPEAPRFLDETDVRSGVSARARSWVPVLIVILPVSVIAGSYIQGDLLDWQVVTIPLVVVALAMVLRLRLLARSGDTDWGSPALLSVAAFTVLAVAVGLTQLHGRAVEKASVADRLTEVVSQAERLDGVAARAVANPPSVNGPAREEWGADTDQLSAEIANIGLTDRRESRRLDALMDRYVDALEAQLGLVLAGEGRAAVAAGIVNVEPAHEAFVAAARHAVDRNRAASAHTARSGRIGSVVGLTLALLLLCLVLVRYGGAGRKAQLAHQAFHDGLTGLPNRAMIEQRLRQAFARSARTLELQSLVMLDVDDFKAVNDSLGHQAGDELLRQIATRLRASVRIGDTLARLDGDGFGILVESTEDPKDSERVAERMLAALQEPFSIEGQALVVAGSIGVAVSDGSGIGEIEQQASVVLRNAELAMYEAKRHDGSSIEVFSAHMHDAVTKRLELKAELINALKEEQFSLVYQPIVDIAERRIKGYEALVRWIHPERGMVSPGDFIPIAEQTGLIVDLGTWVLREACRQLAEWTPGWADERYISVNVAGHQLQREDFAEQVQVALADSGLPPHQLLLEVTESSLIDDVEGSERRMEAVRALGVRFAIDDFGTGYSSLSYLHRFPLDVLKVDKAFIDNVTDDGRGRAIVDAIVNMATSLDLDVVAEGIEEPEQVEALAQLRCMLGQGYHYSRPLPVADVADFELAPGPAGQTAGVPLRVVG